MYLPLSMKLANLESVFLLNFITKHLAAFEVFATQEGFIVPLSHAENPYRYCPILYGSIN